MTTANFNLRGITPELMTVLKREAEQQHISVNLLILKLVEQGICYSQQINRPKYTELDSLAATWSEADAKDFAEASKDFEKIDEKLWL
jgi:hypothetical protein